ncbi:hypothetical protein D3C81_1383430 [compost metagenome]
MPVDPLIHPGPSHGLGGVHRRIAITRGQVADDGVGLPQREVAVLNHRDHGIGVQGQEGGRVGGLEACAPVFALEGNIELDAGPEDLAHVDGRIPAQYP